MQYENNDLTEMENIDSNKLFHKLKYKRRESSLNLEKTITKEERKCKNLITNAFGRETIKDKPNSLKKLEKQLAIYFFGKDGSLTHLIPKLRKELIHKERKKIVKLNNKIDTGDLIFFNHKINEEMTKEQRDKIYFQRKKILYSSNFIKSNYESIKEKNNINKSSGFRKKNHIKIIKSVSPTENKINNIKKIYHKYNKEINNNSNDDDLSQINVNENLKNSNKKTITKMSKSKVYNTNSSIESFSSFSPNLTYCNSNIKKNLKSSHYRNFFKKRRINLLNISSSERRNKIEQYSVKKPIMIVDYFKNTYQFQNKKCNKKVNSYNNDRKELLIKLDNYSKNEEKLSKSLYNIIHENKISKEDKLKLDIETVFDQKLNDDKKLKLNLKDLIKETSINKIDKYQLEKNTILNGINNYLSNNELIKLVKNRKVENVFKARDLVKEIKITKLILDKDNQMVKKIRAKLEKGMELIKAMEYKLNFDQLKLKKKIKSRNIYEKELEKQMKRNYTDYKKKEGEKEIVFEKKNILG